MAMEVDNSVKNEFFTHKFVPAQGTDVPENLQVTERHGV